MYLHERVEEFQLILNKEKSRAFTFDKRSNIHFHFLGFTFYWGFLGRRRMLKLKTQKEKLIKSIQEFYSWVKANRSVMKLKDLWEKAMLKIKGHVNYYGYPSRCNSASTDMLSSWMVAFSIFFSMDIGFIGSIPVNDGGNQGCSNQ